MICHGSCHTSCSKCAGVGRLKWYVELKVHFKNQDDDYFNKSEAIPDKNLRKCEAVSTFSEQNPRVFALNHHQVQEVNRASFDLIQRHLNALQSAKIIMQVSKSKLFT